MVRFIFMPLIMIVLLFLTSCEKKSNLPTDGDGNEYNTVVIGTQVWHKENLKTTKFNSGVPIHLETDISQWGQESLPAYCWYGNVEGLKDPYGAIYNWRAARLGTLCPKGWHTPTIEEWTTMINYLGGESVAGDKLKEEGLKHWYPQNTGATNERGFTALPGGQRDRYGGFSSMGQMGIWWTSSPSYENTALKVFIYGGDHGIYNVRFPTEAGYSVRCVKDNW